MHLAHETTPADPASLRARRHMSRTRATIDDGMTTRNTSPRQGASTDMHTP